jgi:glycosyltransferase involved in cell wall biosynthesis
LSTFTIVSSVYNQYELLRQFIESILYNVDSESYEKVIIIDDFSNPSGKQREYENYINSHYDKFKIITFNEERPPRYYSEIPGKASSLGVVNSYQLALESVTTDYVIICDTDCVFLSKFKSTLNQISQLFEEHPNVMAISQLVGHSSNEIFESDIVGLKNMPAENGGAGGPSPMFTAFRVVAWTEHNIAPIASTPGQRRGNGFIDFFLSVIGNGFKIMNFPFFSGDYVFHIGGGTARRSVNKSLGYGHLKDCGYRYAATADAFVHDYYAGAHKIDMTSVAFTNYLVNKYNIPIDKLASTFDETLLKKYELHPKREVDFKPMHAVVKARMDELLTNESLHNLWANYTYGKPSGIDWPTHNYYPKENK